MKERAWKYLAIGSALVPVILVCIMPWLTKPSETMPWILLSRDGENLTIDVKVPYPAPYSDVMESLKLIKIDLRPVCGFRGAANKNEGLVIAHHRDVFWFAAMTGDWCDIPFGISRFVALDIKTPRGPHGPRRQRSEP